MTRTKLQTIKYIGEWCPLNVHMHVYLIATRKWGETLSKNYCSFGAAWFFFIDFGLCARCVAFFIHEVFIYASVYVVYFNSPVGVVHTQHIVV